MKKNYLKVKIALIGTICAGCFVSQAQTTEVDATTDLVVAAGTYTPSSGSVTFETADLAHDGATFNLQITVTPNDTENIIAAADGWGVGDAATTDVRATFDYQTSDNATIGSIAVVNFNRGTTSYTAASVSNLYFESVGIYASHSLRDRTGIGVNGGAVTNLGRLPTIDEVIPFQSAYSNLAGDSFTLSDVPVTSFFVTNQEIDHAGNRIAIASIKIAYTFTQDNALSINDEVTKDKAFNIYPTVVENEFSVNRTFKTLEIIDITGKTVKTFKASDALEVSGLHSGLYIVRLESEIGNTTSRKLIVK